MHFLSQVLAFAGRYIIVTSSLQVTSGGSTRNSVQTTAATSHCAVIGAAAKLTVKGDRFQKAEDCTPAPPVQ
jgi:hypothetical protein